MEQKQLDQLNKGKETHAKRVNAETIAEVTKVIDTLWSIRKDGKHAFYQYGEELVLALLNKQASKGA